MGLTYCVEFLRRSVEITGSIRELIQRPRHNGLYSFVQIIAWREMNTWTRRASMLHVSNWLLRLDAQSRHFDAMSLKAPGLVPGCFQGKLLIMEVLK